MVDTNPDLKEVDWRPPDWGEATDLQLKDYDFEALHDRIMRAIDAQGIVSWVTPKPEEMS